MRLPISNIMPQGAWVIVTLSILLPHSQGMSNHRITQVEPEEAASEKAASETEELIAAASEGFMEDIKLDSFFQDVGLKKASSVPSFTTADFTLGASASQQSEKTEKDAEDDFLRGFIPKEPLSFAASASSTPDVFSPVPVFEPKSKEGGLYASDSVFEPYTQYSSVSNAFISYPTVQTDPYPVQSNDYKSSPQASNTNYATETKAAPKYEKKEKDDKGGCKKVVKDGMTCEVCEDGYGGFSEHCSHSAHSGKDQKYSNSRRNSNQDKYVPHFGNNNAGGAAHGHQKNNNGGGYNSQPHQGSASYQASNKSPPSHYNSHHPQYNHNHFHHDDYKPHHDYNNNQGHGYNPTHNNNAYNPHKQHQQQQPQHHQQKPVAYNNNAAQHNPQRTHSNTNSQQYNSQPQYVNVAKASNHNPGATHHANYNSFHDGPQYHAPAQRHATNQYAQAGHKNNNAKYHSNAHLPKPAANKPKVTNQAPVYNAKQNNNQKQTTYHPTPDVDNVFDEIIKEYGPFSDHSSHHPHHAGSTQSRTNDVYHPQGSDRHQVDLFHESVHDPFPSAGNYDPYNFDELGIPGSDKSSAGSSHHTVGVLPDPVHAESKVDAKVPVDAHTRQFTHLNPNANFKILGKMVKQFEKKGRDACKKVTKKGMVCYHCPNTNGKTDEECMYSNNDPSGHHIMYTEETSY